MGPPGDSSGFFGEGGVFFVLERQREAENRQCKIYGELAGIGMSSDASHMVTPCSDPVQASRAITEALAAANLLPKQVDYINEWLDDMLSAHGVRTLFLIFTDFLKFDLFDQRRHCQLL